MSTIIISVILLMIIGASIRSVMNDHSQCSGNCGSCGGCHHRPSLYQQYHDDQKLKEIR